MTTTAEPEVKWSQDHMVEVTLNEPDDFLKVRLACLPSRANNSLK